MKVIEDQDKKITVEVCYTHYGHAKEVAKIWLNKSKRQEIAVKLVKGILKERILDDIRSGVQCSNLNDMQKQHFVTNEELRNISNSFGINEVKRHVDDQTSLLSWIQDWASIDSNAVLFYKLEGDDPPPDCPELKTEDFMIVIQSPFQRYMAEKFLQNGFCVDSTHGTTGTTFISRPWL